jgi:hypothetical protein
MTVAWIILAAIPIVGFILLETIALHMQQKGHTCSATLRNSLHTNTTRGRTVWVIIAGICGLLEVWFFAHIILQPGQVWWP